MRQIRSVGILALVAFVWLALAGRASAADFPKGTFTLKGPDSSTWAVTFDGKGKYTVTRDGQEAVEGMYKVTKDEIEFMDVKGPVAETGADKTGTYKWKYADKKLTFTKVKDPAEGRAGVVTSGAWAMKE